MRSSLCPGLFPHRGRRPRPQRRRLARCRRTHPTPSCLLAPSPTARAAGPAAGPRAQARVPHLHRRRLEPSLPPMLAMRPDAWQAILQRGRRRRGGRRGGRVHNADRFFHPQRRYLRRIQSATAASTPSSAGRPGAVRHRPPAQGSAHRMRRPPRPVGFALHGWRRRGRCCALSDGVWKYAGWDGVARCRLAAYSARS